MQVTNLTERPDLPDEAFHDAGYIACDTCGEHHPLYQEEPLGNLYSVMPGGCFEARDGTVTLVAGQWQSRALLLTRLP